MNCIYKTNELIHLFFMLKNANEDISLLHFQHIYVFKLFTYFWGQYAVLVMILFVMKIAAIALWFTMKSGVRYEYLYLI